MTVDGDDNATSDSGSGAGSGLSSAATEEAAVMERAKRATGCWPVITTESLPGGQPAGGADGDSSDRLRDVLALDEVKVSKYIDQDYSW